MADIKVVMGILIQKKKVMVVCPRGKEMFVGPGGVITPHESDRDMLTRKLLEDFQLDVSTKDLRDLGIYKAKSDRNEEDQVIAHAYMVNTWRGIIVPSHEVEEIAWIGSMPPKGMKIGSILRDMVLPELKKMGLIR